MPGLIRTTISVLILSAFTGTAFYRGLVSHPSIPVRKPASVTSPEDNSQEAIDAIARDLEPQLRTLTRPVTVYHWSSTSPTLDAAVEKGKRSAGLFWDSTTDMNYGLVGHGLYAARDPVSSSSFGRRPGASYSPSRFQRMPAFSTFVTCFPTRAPTAATTMKLRTRL